MRCAYLALDRADISETIKCLVRGMSKPRTGRRHGNASKHVWSDRATWTHVPDKLNGTKRLLVVQKVTTHSRREDAQDWLQACLPLAETTSHSYRFFECGQFFTRGGKSTRHINKVMAQACRAKHLSLKVDQINPAACTNT